MPNVLTKRVLVSTLKVNVVEGLLAYNLSCLMDRKNCNAIIVIMKTITVLQ